ncbi:hypothetical protein [Chondrinema litorale]|uniref:hypothetical protein n=1 Tax=Chondrinema litorale TaxID=2994555 RepID=UPI0025431B3C|nr:hypothetical protein [Chondrinema litorale]UZR95873.1 hypothetical protein OQ292_08610 [Chondrinema litorale]
MKDLILKAVNGRENESRAIMLLLGVGFLTGIFIATFDVGAITLFLKYFDEKKDIPRAFFISGILGVTTTYIFGQLQKVISYKTLVRYTILVFAILVLTLSIFINTTDNKSVVFLAYVIFPPINTMVVLIFWGVFSRVFKFRSAKRLASGIDTGQVVATILAFFIIPFIQQYLIEDTRLFLYASSACMVLAVGVYWRILSVFPITETPKVKKQKTKKKKDHTYKKYFWLLSGFVVCSALAAAFIEFSFLTVTAEKFGNAENTKKLTSFISFFSGTVMICSFLIQTFLNDKILEMYGMRNTLILLPGLLLVFGIISTIIGWLFGVTAESVTFLFFFLIISISKLFTDALRDSLEGPVFKNFFYPLDPEIKFTTQAKIEGMVKESAGFLAGILMMLSGLIYFYDVIFNNYVIFLIIACWITIIFFLHKEYKFILTNTLQKNKKDILDHHDIGYAPVLLTTSLSGASKYQVYTILKITKQIKPYLLELNLNYFAKEQNIEAQKVYLEFLFKNCSINNKDLIKSISDFTSDKQTKELMSFAYTYLERLSKISTNFQQLAYLASSENHLERERASILISYNYNQETFRLLITLLRDYNLNVKREAIITAGKLKIKEFLPIIIESLANYELVNTGSEAIISFGEDALQALDIAFYKNNQLQEIRICIVDILGEIGGAKAIQMLLKKIDYPDHKVLIAIFMALKKCSWHGAGFDVIFVKNSINTLASTLLWNLVTIHELPEKKAFAEIKGALEFEIKENKKMMFMLLSLLYDSKSVKLVQENLENGTSEGIGFAMELLDIFLEDELKPLIPPLLDDSPVMEKYKKLEVFFPRPKMTEYELMLEIINKDYNWTNRWTKVCALKVIEQYEDLVISNEISANMFNPDPMISELTASIVYKTDKTYYNNIVKRSNNTTIQEKPSNESSSYHSLVNIFKALKKIKEFKNFPDYILSEIAEITKVEYYSANEMIWNSDIHDSSFLLYLIKGEICVEKEGKAYKTYKENNLISDIFLGFNFRKKQSIISQTPTIIFRVHPERFIKILKENSELLHKLLINIDEISSKNLSQSK